MPLYFNSKSIIPAPFVDIRRNYVKTGDQTTLDKTYDIVITGKLMAWKGSPTSSGTFWDQSGYPPDESIASDSRLAAIEHKQQALRDLFSIKNEGQILEIQPWDGTASIKCNPRILNIEFGAELWFETMDYTVTLQADRLYGAAGILPNDEDTDNLPYYLQDASESWSINFTGQPENDSQQQLFELTHNISAVGKLSYDSTGASLGEAWTQARGWVQSKLGIDVNRMIASGALNVPTYFSGFNQVRTENVDKRGGSYSITENWTIASGSATEEYTVTITSGIDDGLISVGINGSINGLEIRDVNYGITQTRYQSANTKFGQIIGQLQTRAETYSNVTLNSVPTQTVVGKNPVNGNITYTYDFNNRMSPYTAGAKSELVTISDEGGNEVVARIPILGRSLGPILQDMSTKTESLRTVNINLVMPAVTSNNPTDWLSAKPSVSGLLEQLKPVANQVYTINSPDNWEPRTGRFSKNVVYLFGN